MYGVAMLNISSNPFRVLMLGWEYPPHIAGGLGVACEGLTKALGKLAGLEIHFIVPKLLGGESASHMFLHDSFRQLAGPGTGSVTEHYERTQHLSAIMQASHSASATRTSLPASAYSNPSLSGSDSSYAFLLSMFSESEEELRKLLACGALLEHDQYSDISAQAHYGRNVFEEVARYTSRVIRNFGGLPCDLIHAHDWMTYPAAVALKKILGRPLIVHTHSIDFDRSGNNRNQAVYDIERLGIHAADGVIAVSHYTKALVAREYDVSPDKIDVVHNGIYPKRSRRKIHENPLPLAISKEVLAGRGAGAKYVQHAAPVTQHAIKRPAPVFSTVLFLGRVTMQKGPDYFVRAAAKVAAALPYARFLLAGKGDLLPGMIELAHELGIGDRMEFLGFLNEAEVEEAFAEADLYVMPSVSEPFGISALEAINFDTPVIMSRQSGVSEVVLHSLKFDFWDVDRLADLIINGLLHEELRADMIQSARAELERLRWDAAAAKTCEVYGRIVQREIKEGETKSCCVNG